MNASSDHSRNALPQPRLDVEGHERLCLSEGWQAASSRPAEQPGLERLGSLNWLPARVPGTAAGVLRDAGAWQPGEPHDFDAEDWWFRTTFAAPAPRPGEELLLRLDGIATLAEVYLNGQRVLDSESMFARHCLEVSDLLRERNELVVRCRALAPLLDAPRRPRARWRTRLVARGNLRFFRTMLLGRAPGFAPGPAPVGPWRGVWLERRRHLVVEQLEVRAALRGSEGLLAIALRTRALAGFEPTSAHVELQGPSGILRAPLAVQDSAGAVRVRAELAVPDVRPWWPHTHGEPCLYAVRVVFGGASGRSVGVEAGRVGFRSLAAGPAPDHDLERDGLSLHVNGVQVFARGAVWTPVDPVGLAPPPQALRAALEQVRESGMNAVRIPGTSAYEAPVFHELCDELGLLVWQDLMFANFDYPIADDRFRTAVEREVRDVLGALGGHPSTAVVCGNSEIEQQVAMLGLDPALGRGELFGELLPRLVADSGIGAVYVPSAPCGGTLPFRPGAGVANYFGVGGYRRPLEDARRAEVRFAAECLAFSNVPDEAAIDEMLPDAPGELAVHHPRWKAGVPRDAGSGWDFEDVRDHYFELLFGVQPAELRRVDHERYLELSRALTGEVMAGVLGEWRRAGSPCAGAFVLWLRDLLPGAGWGLVDHRGEPKVAFRHVSRALQPICVWMTDEGLAGVRVHVANDPPTPLHARLRVALYRDFERLVGETSESIRLEPHGVREWDLESLLGHFVDPSWAYRFGPPAQDVIIASLQGEGEGGEGGETLSQSVHLPAGRPLAREPATRLGLAGSARRPHADGVLISLRTERFAYGVRVHVPGFIPDDDAFCIEPRGEPTLLVRPRASDSVFAGGWLTALNLAGRVPLASEGASWASPRGEQHALALGTAREEGSR